MATNQPVNDGAPAEVDNSEEGAPRILVVDDEIQVRDVVARILRRRGYNVETANDGASALAAVAHGDFSVIVSDISMPGMDGITLTRCVREIDSDTPIILLTGAPTLETAKAAIELGAFRYLTKPFVRQDLEAAVARAQVVRRMAKLKRDALALLGGSRSEARDIAGLQVNFDRTLAGLFMAFQPIVHAADGTVFGYEALMRSSEPTLPHPEAILDAAERLGRAFDLGRIVRARTARTMTETSPRPVFFVNLLPTDLLDDELLLQDAPLSQHGSRVVLEITERSTISNINQIRGRTSRLRKMGFRIAVDDLGAGYAGLTSFVSLDPDVVKLDMSLIRDVTSSPTKQRVVRSITKLCHETDTLVVAEGVETAAERDTVVDLGCDLVQGFFVGRPGYPFPEVNW
jgi:EAL domain-containing protein (putative c-di-GMP-specific phosphodiesterase class I)